MTETQKLDFILRAIYDTPNHKGNLPEILAEKGLKLSSNDLERLVDRLTGSGFITSKSSTGGAVILVWMRSEGMEFVENSSFVKKDTPIINNHYNISNSSNANIVAYSSQTTITRHYGAEPKQLLYQIQKLITEDRQVTEQQRQDVLDSVDDLRVGLGDSRVPKVSMKQLLEVSAKIASISSFAVKLAEVLHYLPK